MKIKTQQINTGLRRLVYDMLALAIVASPFFGLRPVSAAPSPTDIPEFETTVGINNYGSGNGELSGPRGLATDDNDNVYVVDSYNHRIQKFNGDGTYLNQWGTSGTGEGEFDYPYGLAINSLGQIYVADTGNHRIQKFNGDGTYLDQWGTSGTGEGELNGVTGIAIDNADNVYVVDSGNQRVQKFNSAGAYLTHWGTFGSGNGEFSSPDGIAIDNADNVYVVDTGNSRIQKFSANGTYLDQWGASGTGNAEFNAPYGIAVDDTGAVYVADSVNSRIQKFDSDGTYLTQWGTLGTNAADGEFSAPLTISVSSNGNVYISDGYNNNNDANNNIVVKYSFAAESASVTSSPSGAAIQLEAPAFTTFSCSTSVSEASLDSADTSHSYPLGLIDFCLDVVAGSTNTVTIIFETDLTADKVTARKYLPNSQTYIDVPGATVAEATLDGNPALQLTYSITDGGVLDDDGTANGTILDPVGLAVDIEAQTADETLANTGQSQLIILIGTIIMLGGAGLGLRQRLL